MPITANFRQQWNDNVIQMTMLSRSRSISRTEQMSTHYKSVITAVITW